MECAGEFGDRRVLEKRERPELPQRWASLTTVLAKDLWCPEHLTDAKEALMIQRPPSRRP